MLSVYTFTRCFSWTSPLKIEPNTTYFFLSDFNPPPDRINFSACLTQRILWQIVHVLEACPLAILWPSVTQYSHSFPQVYISTLPSTYPFFWFVFFKAACSGVQALSLSQTRTSNGNYGVSLASKPPKSIG